MPHQLKLSILPAEQQAVWPLLSDTPKEFVLYGGTAIALQLGHRISIDFDFFSKKPFNPDILFQKIPYLKDCRVIQKEADTLTCLNLDNVKISFFGGISLKQIKFPIFEPEIPVKVASLTDLFGMKCSTVCSRIEKKDYLDIHALITLGHLDLNKGLAAAQVLYGQHYHPIMTLKALSYFEGGDLNTLDLGIKTDLLKIVQEIQLEKIPVWTSDREIGDL